MGDILRIARSLGVKDKGQGALGVIQVSDVSEHRGKGLDRAASGVGVAKGGL